MRCIIEFEPRPKGKTVWWRMVTIEQGGLRHVLTVWKEATPAAVRKIAKFEGVDLVEVEPT